MRVDRNLITVSMASLLSGGAAAMPPVEDAPLLPEAQHASSPFALMPQEVTSFGAEVSNNWLYILGGYFGQPHEYSREFQSDTLYRLNLLDRTTWQEVPNEFRAQSVQLVTRGDRLYRVGGMRVRNETGEANDLDSLDSVAMLDPATRRWRALPPMPADRSSHAAEIVGNELYVVGGWDLDGDSLFADWHDDALVLDLEDPDAGWRSIDSPVQRRALAAAAAGDSLVVIGGMTEHDGPIPRVDVYDTEASEWRRGPDFPDRGFGVSAVGAGGWVYASGRNGVVYRWKPGEAQWTPVINLVFPRFFHELVAVDETELLALGGMAPGGRVAHVESIRLDESSPRERTVTWTLPSPSEARNRQGVFLHENTLYLFAGNNSVAQHDFEPENFVRDGIAINLNSMRISPAADFPAARQTIQTVVRATTDDEVGIAVGGFGHDGQRARAHADAYLYDFAEDEWNTAPFKLRSPRSQFGLVAYDDALWVFGGHQFDRERFEEGFHHFRTIDRCDLNSPDPQFTETPHTLPRTRRAFGGALLGGRYYLVGGIGEGFETVDVCDVFNFETKSWETIPSPETHRISPELVALNGKLYLAGGSAEGPSGFQPDRTIEVYDPATREWSTLSTELPFPPGHLRMFPYRGRLLAVSTNDPEHKLIRLALIDVTGQ